MDFALPVSIGLGGMSFVERQIDVTLQYYKTGATMKLTGHRVLLSLVDYPSEAGGMLSMRIYGLPLSVINEFLAIGAVNQGAGITKNKILVEAGNAGSPLTRIFSGAIFNSWGDFSNPPGVNLVIDASVQVEAALTPAIPQSWKGSVSAATIMQTLAAAAGWAFDNNGVNITLNNPAFKGSLQEQMVSCAKQGGFEYTVTPSHVLVIYPKGAQTSSANEMPILTPESGMVGYPMFSQTGIYVRHTFLPGITLGSPFAIAGSQLLAANRKWSAQSIIHTLESQTPNGAWFSELEGFYNEQS